MYSNLIYSLKNIATKAGDTETERIKKSVLMVTVLFKSFGCIVWTTMYYSLGFTLASKFPLAYFFVLILATYYLYRTKKFDVALNIYTFFILIVPFLLQVTMGGFVNSGAVILWSVIAPTGALFFKGIKSGIIWFSAFVILCVISAFYKFNLEQTVFVSDNTIKFFFLMNVIVICGFLLYTIAYFRELTSRQNNELESNYKSIEIQKNLVDIEREKADNLLLNILPLEVAKELKETGQATPHFYEKVTVLFTDFKGFTQHAENLPVQEVIKQLNDCFLVFDEICERYNLEKIKTIGDAYMCAGGLPIPNDSNALDAVKAGLEMQAWVQKWQIEKKLRNEEIWELRVGIHTGSVIAGVIGKNKFAYDIWGDAVNLAARMESSGEVGKVNISGTTYQLVKEQFVCVYRGKIKAKSKGEIDMYFAEG